MMLLISILRASVTHPGSIPEDREWDMISEHSDEEEDIEEEEKKLLQKEKSPKTIKGRKEQFTNYGIEDDADDPKEPPHLDYKYIKSEAGPLY